MVIIILPEWRYIIDKPIIKKINCLWKGRIGNAYQIYTERYLLIAVLAAIVFVMTVVRGYRFLWDMLTVGDVS